MENSRIIKGMSLIKTQSVQSLENDFTLINNEIILPQDFKISHAAFRLYAMYAVFSHTGTQFMEVEWAYFFGEEDSFEDTFKELESAGLILKELDERGLAHITLYNRFPQ